MLGLSRQSSPSSGRSSPTAGMPVRRSRRRRRSRSRSCAKIPTNRLRGQPAPPVVERFFAWIGRNRRLAKDFEETIDSARAFVYAASVMLLVRRIALASGLSKPTLRKASMDRPVNCADVAMLSRHRWRPSRCTQHDQPLLQVLRYDGPAAIIVGEMPALATPQNDYPRGDLGQRPSTGLRLKVNIRHGEIVGVVHQ